MLAPKLNANDSEQNGECQPSLEDLVHGLRRVQQGLGLFTHVNSPVHELEKVWVDRKEADHYETNNIKINKRLVSNGLRCCK